MTSKIISDELKKQKLIQKILICVYADDDPKYDYTNRKFLQDLSYEDLQKMYNDWVNS